MSETVGSLFKHISRRNSDMKNGNVITNSAEYGLIPQRDFFDKDIAVEGNTDKYYIIEHGDFVYNPRKSTAAPYGPFNCYRGKEEGIVSPLYTCLKPLRPELTDFLLWYFRSSAWHSYIYHNGAQGGARHDRVGMTNDLMDGIPISIPCSEERRKISDFLSLLEHRVAVQQKIVDALKSYKRGLSNSFFEAIEASEDCKNYLFGEIFALLQNNTFSREDLSILNGSVRNIHYGDILVKYGAIVNLALDDVPCIRADADLHKFMGNSYLRDGDIVIADTAEDYSVGKATEIIGASGIEVLSGLHTIPCRPTIEFSPMYLGYYLNSTRFREQIYPMVQGTKVSSISKSEIVKASILVPPKSEQRKIASVLYAIDRRIMFEDLKVQALVNAKAALLQQLFI